MNVLRPLPGYTSLNQICLRILATTDLHMNICGYDYYRDQPNDLSGLPRAADLIAALRASADNSLLVDNGDFLQGTPMGDYVALEKGVAPGRPHPAIAAMNRLGFDAGTLGNHDFNYGLDFLTDTLAGAAFPIVSANVMRRAPRGQGPDEPLLAPYAILDRHLRDRAGDSHALRIGIIGFLPPQITTWDRHQLHGRITTRDIVETAMIQVARMKAEGADVILALCHSGIGPAHHASGMENAAVPLAAVDGIDALVTGHSHMVFPSERFDGHQATDTLRGTIHGKPAVMSGAGASHLGAIDLALERRGNRWQVVSGAAVAHPVNRPHPPVDRKGPGDGAVRSAIARDHAATLAYIRRGVGATAQPLDTHFAQIAPSRALALIADAQRDHLRRVLADSRLAALPLLSAASPIKAGGWHGPDHYTNVPAGKLTVRSVADLYCFPNRIAAVRVSGRDLRNWLERAAGMFQRITPNRPGQLLLDPRFPSYNFDVIHGLTWQIDLSRPALFGPKGQATLHPALLDTAVSTGIGRIRDLAWEGTPVSDDMEFIIATNDFRANGGGHFPGTGPGAVVYQAPITTRDILMNHIREIRMVAPRLPRSWRFAPLGGTAVIFETSPAASPAQARETGLDLRRTGTTDQGFARFELVL